MTDSEAIQTFRGLPSDVQRIIFARMFGESWPLLWEDRHTVATIMGAQQNRRMDEFRSHVMNATKRDAYNRFPNTWQQESEAPID